jgi:hypothetical protein
VYVPDQTGDSAGAILLLGTCHVGLATVDQRLQGFESRGGVRWSYPGTASELPPDGHGVSR